jgi:hypothetical protein
MYYIYSPKKHKVYRIGIARVEDREGLDNHYNIPCLEDKVLIPIIEILDYPSSKGKGEISDDENNKTIP